jgi:hypothetical protein
MLRVLDLQATIDLRAATAARKDLRAGRRASSTPVDIAEILWEAILQPRTSTMIDPLGGPRARASTFDRPALFAAGELGRNGFIYALFRPLAYNACVLPVDTMRPPSLRRWP